MPFSVIADRGSIEARSCSAPMPRIYRCAVPLICPNFTDGNIAVASLMSSTPRVMGSSPETTEIVTGAFSRFSERFSAVTTTSSSCVDDSLEAGVSSAASARCPVPRHSKSADSAVAYRRFCIPFFSPNTGLLTVISRTPRHEIRRCNR